MRLLYNAALVLALTCMVSQASAGRLRTSLCTAESTQAIGDVFVGGNKPWFCHGLDCPEFEVTNRTRDYEARKYEKANWVGTTVESLPLNWALPQAVGRLLAYISGANLDQKALDVTAPVVVLLRPKYGFREAKKDYTVAFFLPTNETESPVPRDRAVNVHSSPSSTLYVRSFGGFAAEQDILRMASRLAYDLEEDGIEVNKNWFYFASYDPPLRFCHRHNEIWMLPKNATHADEIHISLALNT